MEWSHPLHVGWRELVSHYYSYNPIVGVVACRTPAPTYHVLSTDNQVNLYLHVSPMLIVYDMCYTQSATCVRTLCVGLSPFTVSAATNVACVTGKKEQNMKLSFFPFSRPLPLLLSPQAIHCPSCMQSLCIV